MVSFDQFQFVCIVFVGDDLDVDVVVDGKFFEYFFVCVVGCVGDGFVGQVCVVFDV